MFFVIYLCLRHQSSYSFVEQRFTKKENITKYRAICMTFQLITSLSKGLTFQPFSGLGIPILTVSSLRR
ncbi:hypothetical protein XENTR_v10020414 [Xenopus tropicalis]|nr:hypothetical protein XENTR_v10020414 [Xenopus tropicalis]